MKEDFLLCQIKKQRPQALERLIDLYTPYVRTIVASILGEWGTAEDREELISDIFLAVWDHAQQIQPGKLKAYLGASARNKSKDFLRAIRPLEMDVDDVPALTDGTTPENQFLRQEQQRLVRQALDAMPSEDREIFLRYYYYLQTSQQIAAAMDMTASAVRTRLMRGRNTLKQTLLKEDIL